MARQTDEQLMSAVLLGDNAALTPLVERYHAPLLAYLYRLTHGNSALAEDLVQETFLRLLRPNGYQHSRTFKPWIYAIATNLARDHFKSAAIRHSVKPDEESFGQLEDVAPGPEAAVLASETSEQIAEAFRQLGEEYRAALLLRFYQGMSLQEIAEILHIPLGTVKSRLSNGTRRLRALLEKAGEREALR